MIIAAMFLPGCGEPKIDGTSDETFQSSIEVVKAALPEADRLQFDKALMCLKIEQIIDSRSL